MWQRGDISMEPSLHGLKFRGLMFFYELPEQPVVQEHPYPFFSGSRESDG